MAPPLAVKHVSLLLCKWLVICLVVNVVNGYAVDMNQVAEVRKRIFCNTYSGCRSSVPVVRATKRHAPSDPGTPQSPRYGDLPTAALGTPYTYDDLAPFMQDHLPMFADGVSSLPVYRDNGPSLDSGNAKGDDDDDFNLQDNRHQAGRQGRIDDRLFSRKVKLLGNIKRLLQILKKQKLQ